VPGAGAGWYSLGPPRWFLVSYRTAHPDATVVERRATIGDVCIAEMQCPLDGHVHTVGVTEPATTLWRTYGAGQYTVTIPPKATQ